MMAITLDEVVQAYFADTEFQKTRQYLGEYVWLNYQEVTLKDWAAPAIQYCRALEFELRRRLYDPCPQKYLLTRVGFTLGTITNASMKRSFDRLVFRLISDIFEAEKGHELCLQE